LNGIGAFRAHLYAAFHSGRSKETPRGSQAMSISRSTLNELSGGVRPAGLRSAGRHRDPGQLRRGREGHEGKFRGPRPDAGPVCDSSCGVGVGFLVYNEYAKKLIRKPFLPLTLARTRSRGRLWRNHRKWAFGRKHACHHMSVREASFADFTVLPALKVGLALFRERLNAFLHIFR
jgi:hypothetical protein